MRSLFHLLTIGLCVGAVHAQPAPDLVLKAGVAAPSGQEFYVVRGRDVGVLADLLVLHRDYVTVPADQIRSIRPAATVVGGRIVHGSL